MKTLIILTSIILFSTIGAQIPTSGLLAYYPFTGNTNDLSGNGQNGTAYNTSLTTDRFGNVSSAYNFNGSSSYISLPAGTFTTLNVYSYSCWIKPSAFAGGFALSMGDALSGIGQTLSYQSTGSITAGSYNSGNNPTQSLIHSSGTYSVNQWLHILMTRDLSSLKLYVNGVLQSSSPVPNTGGQNASYGSPAPLKAYIGARSNLTFIFNGAIDDVRIYSTALTQSDVSALYNENCFQNITSTSYSICSGNSVALSATPASSNTINWYSSLTSTSSIGSGTLYTTPTLSAAGIYTFYAGASSCTLSSQRLPITVSVSPTPTIIVPGGAICSGNSFTINPSGASSYSYSSGSVVSPASTTSYSVVGQSASGCLSNMASVTVTVNISPTITVNSGFVCNGNSFTLSPSGAGSYTYSGGSAIVTPTSNTSYTVIGSNGTGCFSSAVSNVGVVANPTLSVSGNTSICSGNTSTLTVSGGNFHTWSTGATTNTIALSPSLTTVYSVSGVNLFGCLSTKMISVAVNPLPVISVNSGTICLGKSFTIVPSGAASYTISGGSNIVSPASNSSYSITGTSASGCLSQNTAVSQVTVLALPAVAVNSGSICAGNTFSLIPSGGISYTFSGGSANVNPLSSTNYTVTGLGANGCSNTAVASVSVIPGPVVSISSPNSLCSGSSLTLTANGASSYTWNTGAVTASIVVSPTATISYSVVGSNAGGCTSSTAKNLTVNPLPFVTVNSGSVCSGKSFTLIAGGASTYTFTGGSNVVSPVSNSTYSVSGTSASGCVSSNTAVASVSVIASPVITVNSGTICSGSSFTLSPGGGTSYTYSGGSALVSPLSTSQYTVTGTNSGGCSSTAISTVVVNALPTVIITGPAAVCAGSAAVLLATGAVSYSWNTGSISPSISVSPSSNTSYSVTGIAANGCSNTASINLLVNTLPLVSVNSGSICLGNSFTLTPSGAASYTYSGGTNVVNPTVNASYSITGTSAQGCVSGNTAVATVSVVNPPSISVNSGSICAGNIFTLSPSGALTYSYSGGSATVSPSTSSTYTVRGINAQGCLSSPVTASVNVIALPFVTVNSGAICSGNSFTLVPAGALNYTISGGASVVSPSVNSTYSVTGSNLQGCTSPVALAQVTVNPLPIVTVNSGSVCAGQTFTLFPSGASSYSYSAGSNTVIPLSNTNYTVSGTSAQGCPSANQAISSVTVIAAPVITVNSGSICSGTSFVINPSGATSYTFSGGNSSVSPSVTTAYTVTGSNSSGCVSAPAVANVSVEANPTLAISGTTVTCSGQTTTLTASGASTYTWSIGTQSAIAVVSPTISTTYTVIGINTNNGCFSSAIQNVSVNTLPLISAPSGTICTGASFVINPSGASTYSYAGGSATVSPTANTSYTVSGISAAGCAGANIATVNVFVNPLPLVVVSGATAVCAGESLTLNASGASSYVWSNSASGNSITVSPAVATVYSVIGTDANNCSANASISIVVNTLPTITVASGAICPGNSFTLTPSGAISYTYSGGTDIVSPQTTTNYSISGTSADGCVSALPAVATVSVVNTLTVTISGNSTICEGDTLYLTANGASNYLWDSGFTTNTIAVSPQANATYSVLGVSGTCTNSASFSVLVNPAPLISVNSGSICLGNTFTFNPTGAVSYTFSSGSVTVSPLVNSVYTVSGTDTNNCSAANTATVSVLALPILSVTSSQADFMCEGVTALLTVSGASTYTWNLGVTNSTIAIMPTSTTLYSVSGTDANGCKNSVAFIQNVDPCLGIAQKKQNSNDFLLYPNPNTGHFYVELTDNINSLTIENLEGKTLYTLQITKHENKTEINVPLLQPGIYFCKVQTNDSLIIKKLIISQ